MTRVKSLRFNFSCTVRARTPARRSRCPTRSACVVHVGAQGLDVGEILFERLLGADALRLAIGDDRARIDGLGQLPEVAPRRRRAAARASAGRRGDVTDGRKPHRARRSLRAWARRPTAARRAAGQERRAAAGRHLELAVRLGEVRGDLGDQLDRRRCRPRRGGSTSVAMRAPQRLGDLRRGPNSAPEAVTSRNASSSDSGSKSGVTECEDVEDLVAGSRVGPWRGRTTIAVGREAQRARHRHGAADAERPHLVRGREHDAAAGVAADDDGLAPQRRVVALLDGRVERVHVEVDDRPGRRRAIPCPRYRRLPRRLRPSRPSPSSSARRAGAPPPLRRWQRAARCRRA